MSTATHDETYFPSYEDSHDHNSIEAERAYRMAFSAAANSYHEAYQYDPDEADITAISMTEQAYDKRSKAKEQYGLSDVDLATMRGECHGWVSAAQCCELSNDDQEQAALVKKWHQRVKMWMDTTPTPGVPSPCPRDCLPDDCEADKESELSDEPQTNGEEVNQSNPLETLTAQQEINHRKQLHKLGRQLTNDAFHAPMELIFGKMKSLATQAQKIYNVQHKAIDYGVISSLEFDSGEYHQEYFIDNVLTVKQPCIIGAPQKCFKTTIAVDLCTAMVSGRPFLGHFKVNRPANVVMMSAESGMATLQATARSICDAANVSLRNLDRLFWCDKVPKIGDDNHMESLGEMLEKNKIEILIVDPVYLAMPAVDPGNVFAQGTLLASINDVCQRLGVTLILVHHLKKTRNNVNEPPGLDELTWSGFAEWARQWILLGRRELYEPPSVHRLWLVTGGSAGHSGLWGLDIDQGEFIPGEPREWLTSLVPGHEVRKQGKQAADNKREAKATAKLNADIQRVRSVLVDLHPNGETQTVIGEKAGVSNARTKAALQAMVERGIAIPCEVMKADRKTPREGYRLNLEEGEPIPFFDAR